MYFHFLVCDVTMYQVENHFRLAADYCRRKKFLARFLNINYQTH